MIGNVVLDNDINSATISELHNNFRTKYIKQQTSGNEYLFANPLEVINHGDSNWDQYNKALEPNETVIIRDKWFKDGDDAISLTGEIDAGQTVIVEGCRFSGGSWQMLYVGKVDKVIIRGNYFHDLGMCSRVSGFKHLEFEYNTVKDHATKIRTYSGKIVSSNCFIINSTKDCEHLSVAYNLIDSTNHPDFYVGMTDRERHPYAWKGDWINIRLVQMKPGVRGLVHHNIESGSVTIGETGTTCGIICDHACKGIDIYDNTQLNAGQSMLGTANGKDIRIFNNTSLYTVSANRLLMMAAGYNYVPRSDTDDRPTTYKHANAIATTTYQSDHASYDDWYDYEHIDDSNTHEIYGNKGYTHRDGSTTEIGYSIGLFSSLSANNLKNNMFDVHDNNFDKKKNSDGSIYTVLKDSNPDYYSGYYLCSDTDMPTPDEMYQYIYGVNEGDNTRDGNGNSLMHIKHGAPENSVYYFKLDRPTQ